MTAAKPSQAHKYILRLYVADGTPHSLKALRNLKRLCATHLAGRYTIEVIDLLQNPERAKVDQILAVPTLVREIPTPIRKFIGNLSDPNRVLIDFDLQSRPADATAGGEGGAHV